MAHKYDNFDDAFDDLKAKWALIKQNNAWALANAQDAYPPATDPVDQLHYGFLCYAVELNCATLYSLTDSIDSNWDRSHFFESIYWANKDAPDPPEFDLTYIKICEAWAKDDFKGRAVTIAFIDRMRQLIWDEPFYAVWAARPEKQEF